MIDLFTVNPQEKVDIGSQALGEEWAKILDANTLYTLGEIISKIDENKSNINFYPSTDIAFKSFLDLPPQNIKVVILSQSAYPNDNADGYAFSCAKYATPSLRQIYYTITKDPNVVDKTIPFQYPLSLVNWVKQGVLLINIKSIVKEDDPQSLSAIGWDVFTSNLLNTLSRIYPDIIFCLWGADAKNMEKHINQKAIVLTDSHPVFASRQNALWQCDHFEKINILLYEKNKLPITWI